MKRVCLYTMFLVFLSLTGCGQKTNDETVKVPIASQAETDDTLNGIIDQIEDLDEVLEQIPDTKAKKDKNHKTKQSEVGGNEKE
ncbi:MAG: hypothetical protein ACI4CT_09045 [Lachnospiraceae bacterium]